MKEIVIGQSGKLVSFQCVANGWGDSVYVLLPEGREFQQFLALLVPESELLFSADNVIC